MRSKLKLSTHDTVNIAKIRSRNLTIGGCVEGEVQVVVDIDRSHRLLEYLCSAEV